MDADVVVIGAGIVGQAIAKTPGEAGRDVFVLESAGQIGAVTSSRSSEFIHAGLYYPKESLKACLCVAGSKLIFQYCESRAMPHKRTGKPGIAASEKEPEMRCIADLSSPSSGIPDSHALMLLFQTDAEAAGAMFASNRNVMQIDPIPNGYQVSTSGEDTTSITCHAVVNCAGHDAQTTVHKTSGFPGSCIPPQFFAKGNNYSVSDKSPVSQLIYPTPEKGGLGDHTTLDPGGGIRPGPDIRWVDRFDFAPNASHLDKFGEAVQKFWPAVATRKLSCAYRGVRPKIVGAGMPDADFVISGPADRVLMNYVCLFGIKSPRLTCALSLADHAMNKLTELSVGAK